MKSDSSGIERIQESESLAAMKERAVPLILPSGNVVDPEYGFMNNPEFLELRAKYLELFSNNASALKMMPVVFGKGASAYTGNFVYIANGCALMYQKYITVEQFGKLLDASESSLDWHEFHTNILSKTYDIFDMLKKTKKLSRERTIEILDSIGLVDISNLRDQVARECTDLKIVVTPTERGDEPLLRENLKSGDK